MTSERMVELVHLSAVTNKAARSSTEARTQAPDTQLAITLLAYSGRRLLEGSILQRNRVVELPSLLGHGTRRRRLGVSKTNDSHNYAQRESGQAGDATKMDERFALRACPLQARRSASGNCAPRVLAA